MERDRSRDWSEAPDGTNIHSPPNKPGPTPALWAWVSDDGTGEGICAEIIQPLGATPLVAGSEALALKLEPLAAKVGKLTGRKVRLVLFARRAVVKEL